jgi:FkbM family methyltransferase
MALVSGNLYREIFARQYYYFRANTDSPVILDCRANIGMATLYFKWLYPKARIEAFEPDPNAFVVLERNIARNRLTNVVAHNCALWDGNGQIEFFVDRTHPGSLLMSADASFPRGSIHSVRQMVIEYHHHIGNRRSCLADFLRQLETSGFEYQIHASLWPVTSQGIFQDMLIGAHRRETRDASFRST